MGMKKTLVLIVVVISLMSTTVIESDVPEDTVGQFSFEAGAMLPMFPKLYYNQPFIENGAPDEFEWDKTLMLALARQEIDLGYIYVNNEVYYAGASDLMGYEDYPYDEDYLYSTYRRFQDNLLFEVKIINGDTLELTGIGGLSIYHLHFSQVPIDYDYYDNYIIVPFTSLFGFGYDVGVGMRVKTHYVNFNMSLQFRKPYFGTGEFVGVHQFVLPMRLMVGTGRAGFCTTLNLEYLHGSKSEDIGEDVDITGSVIGGFLTGGAYLYL